MSSCSGLIGSNLCLAPYSLLLSLLLPSVQTSTAGLKQNASTRIYACCFGWPISGGCSGGNHPRVQPLFTSMLLTHIGRRCSGECQQQRLSSSSRFRNTRYACEQKWRRVEGTIKWHPSLEESALHFIQNPFWCSLHWCLGPDSQILWLTVTSWLLSATL